MSGRASLVADDGEYESFHRSVPARPVGGVVGSGTVITLLVLLGFQPGDCVEHLPHRRGPNPVLQATRK